MPILKQYRHFYGPAWRKTRREILRRAEGCCERCGKPDRALVYVLDGGVWFDERLAQSFDTRLCWRGPASTPVQLMPPEARGVTVLDGLSMDIRHTMAWKDGVVVTPRAVRVVVCVCHRNHTPGDDRAENLAAWCQYCHLTYDLEQHHISRAVRKDSRRPLLALAG